MVATRWLERLAGLSDRRLSSRALEGLQRHREVFLTVGAESGLSPALLAGIAAAESEVQPGRKSEVELPTSSHALGETRAQGMMQVIPVNLVNLDVPKSSWLRPLPNVRAAARLLLEPPAPYGEATLDATLKEYRFGSLDRDASSYIKDVETLAVRAWAEAGIPVRI
jgi:hypothetical protein